MTMNYAATAQPIVPQTAITTSEAGLRCARSSYSVAGFDVPFFYAAPEGKSNLPVVLVVQEIFGLHDYIVDVCRRLAQQGYLALAPELYARQGDASSYTDIGALMSELVNHVPQAQVMADLDGALDWAVTQGGDRSRVGITGFCWGGRVTWLYCAHNPQIRAGVAWYGRLVGVPTPLAPLQPVNIAAQLQAPVLGLYGGQDAGIPLSTVDEMKQALATAAAQGNAAAAASEFVLYPDAPHAFHADYRPSYRPADAADGYQRTLRWFAAHGVV